METYEWITINKKRWAVSILRFSYYLTGVLTILMFVTPFYALFVYLWPQAALLLSKSASIYVTVISVIYGVSFMILTAILVVLHSLGEKTLSGDP